MKFILIRVLNLNQLTKLVEFDDVIILKTIKIGNCQWSLWRFKLKEFPQNHMNMSVIRYRLSSYIGTDWKIRESVLA